MIRDHSSFTSPDPDTSIVARGREHVRSGSVPSDGVDAAGAVGGEFLEEGTGVAVPD